VRELFETPASTASRAPRLEGKRVVGIVTTRPALRGSLTPVKNIMTPRDKLVTVKEGASLEERSRSCTATASSACW